MAKGLAKYDTTSILKLVTDRVRERTGDLTTALEAP
jgi:hypothetical protein